MEKPSAYLQLAIASSAFLTLGLFLGIFYGPISGLVDISQVPLAESGFGIPLLTISFGLFALLLLWWRNALGYISGIVSGILFLINGVFATSDALAGNVPVGSAIIMIPLIIFGLILIATSYLAWRE
jgi:hypothetical protein